MRYGPNDGFSDDLIRNISINRRTEFIIKSIENSSPRIFQRIPAIFPLIERGMSNSEIAKTLGVSKPTITRDVKNLVYLILTLEANMGDFKGLLDARQVRILHLHWIGTNSHEIARILNREGFRITESLVRAQIDSICSAFFSFIKAKMRRDRERF